MKHVKLFEDFLNEAAQQHEYMMLSRLQQDCDYFLGHGNGSERNLWAGNVEDQIKEMTKLYNSLKKKPDWISMDDIKDYETKMLKIKK